MKEQIVEMLSNGIPASNVAAALGLTDSYVSQVLQEEGISQQVAANRAARFSEAVARDTLLNAAEAKALARLDKLVDFTSKPGEAARIFQVLNAAKRATGAQAHAQAPGGAVVALQLPQAARVTFLMSSDKQVVEVEGRSMVTMQAKTLVQQLDQRRAERQLAVSVDGAFDVEPLPLTVQKRMDMSEVDKL